MSYTDLRALGLTFRPIDHWPAEPTRDRQYARFRASLSDTAEVLGRELRHLAAKRIVLQVAMEERDIRLDGFPRSTARATHPGVVLAFESKHGPIKFAVDTYRDWEDNLRAIALGMQALRAVDRYGVTKRGEQYTGWKALPASTDPADAIATREQARDYLDRMWGGDVKRALMETHPDRGGDAIEFRKVQRAREILGGAS